MKNKSFKQRFSDFLTQRLHGRNRNSTNKLVKPDSERELTRSVIEDILRWADDGGQMLDLGISVPGKTQIQLGNEQTNDECQMFRLTRAVR
jgi:hypothetical protein